MAPSVQRAVSLLSAVLLLINTVAGQVVDAATPSKQYPYRYNNVAVTGGGFLTGFVAHPTAKNLIYVRTDIGSSYKWDDANDIWVPLTDFISEFNYFGTESIALDPTDANRLYLAQGQYHTGPAAFFTSNNRGASFSVHPAPFVMGSNDLGRNNGERLAVNPFNPKQLYMGTRFDGLWVSNDRAQTWTNVTNFPNAAANGMGLYFVLFDPSHNGTIYVGASVPGGLYYTKNGGSTWAQVPNQPMDWSESPIYAAVAPGSTGPQPAKGVLGSNGILYVTYADAPGPYGINYGQVQKYNTSTPGFTRTNITPGNSGKNNNTYPPPLTPNYATGGFGALSILPSDPDYVITMTLNHYAGGSDSMFLSHDGGASWKDVAQLSSPQGVNGNWAHPWQEAALENGTSVNWLTWNWSGGPNPVVGTVSFGWWTATAIINPTNPDEVWYGTGATIYGTNNITRVVDNYAPTWFVNAQGIEETANLALISPLSGANLLSGFSDINGFRHTSLNVPQPMLGAPVFSAGNDLDWAGQAPNVIVRVGTSNGAAIAGCPSGAYSTDEGQGWHTFGTCIPGVNSSSYSGGIINVDASGKFLTWTAPQPFDASIANGPFFSADMGTTWSVPLGLNVQTDYIASDKVQAKTFYAFVAGTFYVSTDGGASYSSVAASASGLPAGASVTPVVSLLNAGEVWLPIPGQGLYHSTNFGKKFTKAAGNITAEHFAVGMHAPGHPNKDALYLWGTVAAGGVVGLYRSDDGASTWVRINDDQHNYGGAQLIQGDSRVFGRCYLGMNGRGIVYADIAADGAPGSVAPGTYGL